MSSLEIILIEFIRAQTIDLKVLFPILHYYVIMTNCRHFEIMWFIRTWIFNMQILTWLNGDTKMVRNLQEATLEYFN